MAPFDPYTHVIKPMLAESRQTPFDSKDHIFELKWDGTRALAVVRDGLRFQNRRLSYVESRYPDLAVHTRKPAILDGEIVVMNGPLPSFEKLQQREQASGKIKIDHLAKTLPATYIVLDVLYVGDEAASGPVSPNNSDGRSSSGSSPCGKRSARSPRCRRSMPTSGSGPNPRLSSRRTSSSSRRTVTCARRRSPACATTSGRRSASSRSREFSTPLCAADAIGAAAGNPHDETRVDGRRDLCEGSESGTNVLHQEDRAEGAIVDAQVGLSGPGRDEGRRGRGPHPMAAGPGVGEGNV